MGQSRKVLQLVVRSEWVVDTLQTLGPGKMYHLSYKLSEVDDEVLEDLGNHVLGPGSPAEVVLLSAGQPVRVAEVELAGVHDNLSYYRFDFRIRRTLPWRVPPQKLSYLCRYVE